MFFFFSFLLHTAFLNADFMSWWVEDFNIILNLNQMHKLFISNVSNCNHLVENTYKNHAVLKSFLSNSSCIKPWCMILVVLAFLMNVLRRLQKDRLKSVSLTWISRDYQELFKTIYIYIVLGVKERASTS